MSWFISVVHDLSFPKLRKLFLYHPPTPHASLIIFKNLLQSWLKRYQLPCVDNRVLFDRLAYTRNQPCGLTALTLSPARTASRRCQSSSSSSKYCSNGSPQISHTWQSKQETNTLNQSQVEKNWFNKNFFIHINKKLISQDIFRPHNWKSSICNGNFRTLEKKAQLYQTKSMYQVCMTIAFISDTG